MTRNIVAFCLLWFGLIVQSTLFQVPPIRILQPNLVLVILVVAALTRGPKVALVLGVLIGFIQDVDYGSFLGLYAFTYGVVGYFSAATFSQFLHRNVAITFLVVILFTFIEQWMTFGLTRLLDVTGFSWHAVLSDSLWEMILNGIVCLLLYPFLMRSLRTKPRGRYAQGNNDSPVS